MKEMEIIITKESFSSEREYEAFLQGERGWDWKFNIDRNLWGYGDDGRDWENRREKWIDTPQIIGVEEKNGHFIIYYEE